MTGRDSEGNPCQVDLEEIESCNTDPCPVWTPWTEWTECTQTCGGGTRKKVRECVAPKALAADQCGDESPQAVEKCNEQPCPTLTPWSDWTACSKSCGSGSQRRIRQCKLPTRDFSRNPCLQPLEEERECNSDECPVWTEWSDWTQCSVSCGGGSQSKVRECKEALGEFC